MPFVDPVGLDASIRWWRLLAITAAVSMPQVLFCLSGNITLGGAFLGKGGMKRDLVAFFFWLLEPAFLVGLIIGRRLIGDVVLRIEERLGVTLALPERIGGSSVFSRVLRLLEWVTRLAPSRAMVWLGVFIPVQILLYAGQLGDGYVSWLSSPATPGTLFHFAHVRVEQPNLAGLWLFFVEGPYRYYLYLLMARLVVDFAFVCLVMAEGVGKHIVPTHPDEAGGMQPVGQTALFFSLPIFLTGLLTAMMALQDLLIWKKASVNMDVYAAFLLYVIFAPLLFLLPMLPLRHVMFSAKTTYLFKLHGMYRALDATSRERIHHDMAGKGEFDQQFAVLKMIEMAENMSVWPFDRKTLIRFGGIVVSPLLPILGMDAPNLIQGVVRYFRSVVIG